MQSSIHNEYQHAERRQSAGKRPIVNKRNLKCEPRSRRTAAECPNKLTSWIGTARRLQLCVPCLPVTCLTDLKLLILLLLELRLVAKHVAQSEPRWASAPEHPDKRPNVRQGAPLKQPKRLSAISAADQSRSRRSLKIRWGVGGHPPIIFHGAGLIRPNLIGRNSISGNRQTS